MPRKKEMDYFDVLIAATGFAKQAAAALDGLLTDYVDVSNKAQAIHDLEHAADNECHCLIDSLHVAFITPIDREDLYGMIRSIDDITDLIEDVANRFHMFNITTVRPEAVEMSALIVRATTVLHQALVEFKQYKKSKQVFQLIKDVNSVEEEGDRAYRRIVREMFLKEENPIEIMKWKEIFDDMENVIDSCEDVADIIEGVVMKNS